MFIFDMLGKELSLRVYGIDPHTILNPVNQIELSATNVNAAKLYMGVVSFGSFILTSLIVILTFQKRILSFTSLDVPPKLVNVIISLLILVVSIPLVNWLLALNQSIPIPPGSFMDFLEHQEELNNFTYDVILTGNTGLVVVLNLFLIGLIPAMGEELFFRGIMMRIFKSLTGNIHLGIWLSALLFATLHFQVLKIVPMILLGAMFGYIYYLSGSLWITIILHFVNNSIAVLLDYFDEPHTGGNPLMDDQASFAWYLVLGSAALVTVLFISLKKLNPNPPDLQIE